MTYVLNASQVHACVQRQGVQWFLEQCRVVISDCMMRWDEYTHGKRLAAFAPTSGVIELMPCHDQTHFAFKCVNGHPDNAAMNKASVVAFGAWMSLNDGYPKLIAEMTLLTAIRTAATSALAVTYGALNSANVLGLIGTGAQAEFQVLAIMQVRNIKRCIYYDNDAQAMVKFAKHAKTFGIQLQAATDAEQVARQSHILITATSVAAHQHLVLPEWLSPGQMVLAIGGDAPGKTELHPQCLKNAKILVEYPPQTQREGEVQHQHRPEVVTLADCVRKLAILRAHDDDLVIFDGVGYALEDWAVLSVLHHCLEVEHASTTPWLPCNTDPKNLFEGLEA